MRVTGGKSKGRLLANIKGLNIRPTSGRVREAIFDLLGQNVSGLKVVDLFAGTGSLGIEALSRGALRALFIDDSSLAIKTIHKNLRLCGYENSSNVLKRDIMKGLPLEHRFFQGGIDLAFIDPPYGRDFIPPVLKELSEGKIMTPFSVVVAESIKGVELPARVGGFRLGDTRIYGETQLDIYYRKGI